MKVIMTKEFMKDLRNLQKPFKKIRGWYYDIKNGVINIFKWLPIVWIDRDWDYEHIYNFLYHKLVSMEEHHRKYNPFVERSKQAQIRQIRLAKCLAERLWKHDYLFNALIPVRQIYGEAKIEFSKPDENGCVSLLDNESVEEKRAYKKAYDLSDYTEQQDMDMLFKIINKHIRNWWT